ncbi:MAG: sortase [Anaerolineae bacterium]|nr:sortase [Anaerolineae bacterium]
MTSINRNRSMIFIAFIVVIVSAAFVPATLASDQVTISIPSLNVESGIKQFPLNGVSWTIRPWETGIGHLEGTGWFDVGGNIALAAHSSMPDESAGIFASLHHVNVGDTINVHVGSEERVYSVVSVGSASINDLAPLYPTANERITLITCQQGTFDAQSQVYTQRVVVVADRIS